MDNRRNGLTIARTGKQWNIHPERREHADEIAALAEELGVLPVTAALLYERGCTDAEKAKSFLRLEETLLHDPFLLCDMDKAVDRIQAALADGEKIVVYGDYDVDGVTSVASLYLYLKSRGADVGYYIPSRLGEGYGVNRSAIDSFAEQGVRLIITVDTGVTAAEEIRYAVSRGVSVVVTDHHECHDGIPDAADAVVNPRRPDCAYPFKELAGVGVVFKLLCALEAVRHRGDGTDWLSGVCRGYIDLVTIGTVADVMPLTDENRLIVAMGLRALEESARPGIAALLRQSSSDKTGNARKRKITSSLIGYVLAPRINAAGRIANAERAVELFLTESPAVADRIAAELCETNRQRQNEENAIAEQAGQKLREGFDFERDPVIVLADDGWHHGVIGIVASRLTEQYNLPSILISFEGDTGKGSGRSIKGLNLVEALKDSAGCLLKFGGHELAAGLSIRREKLPEFTSRINAYARRHLRREDLVTTLDLDCEVTVGELSLRQASELYLLEPYGVANPVPQFVLRGAVIRGLSAIGGNRHTRMNLEKDGCAVSAVFFGMVAEESGFFEGDTVDAVFNLDINDFQGKQTVQLILRDLRPAQPAADRLLHLASVYGSLRNGGAVPTDCVPARDDFVKLYVRLRDECRQGRTTVPLTRLASLIGQDDGAFCRCCLVVEILREMEVIDAQPLGSWGVYRFTVNPMKSKIDLNRSEIYRSVRERAVRSGA